MDGTVVVVETLVIISEGSVEPSSKKSIVSI